MPGLVEADDDGLYVVKFRGAGQAPKSLVAELVAGRLGQLLGLPIPEQVLVELDPALGRAEPDPEIQDLLDASAGVNAGLDFLPGALAYGPTCGFEVQPDLAAEIVWFDALTANVDRTPRNPNLLVWHGRLWLIDHGAALYHQHGDFDPARDARRPFPAVRDHVLLPAADSILAADARLGDALDRTGLERVVDEVPDSWLDASPQEARAGYVEYLWTRLAPPRLFAQEAEEARGRL